MRLCGFHRCVETLTVPLYRLESHRGGGGWWLSSLFDFATLNHLFCSQTNVVTTLLTKPPKIRESSACQLHCSFSCPCSDDLHRSSHVEVHQPKCPRTALNLARKSDRFQLVPGLRRKTDFSSASPACRWSNSGPDPKKGCQLVLWPGCNSAPLFAWLN